MLNGWGCAAGVHAATQKIREKKCKYQMLAHAMQWNIDGLISVSWRARTCVHNLTIELIVEFFFYSLFL